MCFFYDSLADVTGQFVAAKKLVHPRKVHVEFVNAALFQKWDFFLYDFRDYFGKFAVGARIAFNDNTLWAKCTRYFHTHA